ncbi:MAG TPA: glycosyltransferase family 4 protein [Solirubrobacteraceae bacterium]|jgi:glycosyltransferase involved in cell wall biosynthesis
MVLFLHNRYRTVGGEERVVEDLMGLVRERLGEPVELVSRDSAAVGRPRAALGLLRGGLDPREVAAAVRRDGARVVHAHNLHPSFGWRALAAAREAGARVVLHLHQYRLVCATGTCFTKGEPCTRCHGRNTLPGVIRNCRESRAEALAYGPALALWQRRTLSLVDAVVVPSRFAADRLKELGAPLPWDRLHVLAPPLSIPDAPSTDDGAANGTGVGEGYALAVARLSSEKGLDVAIDACRGVGMALVIAGEGPCRQALEARAAGADVRFVGRVEGDALDELRRRAAIALVPSRAAETFGLAAAEAMAAGLPVVASDAGALPELVDPSALVPAGDAVALADAITRLAGDAEAGARNRERVAETCAPERVAARLAGIYGR